MIGARYFPRIEQSSAQAVSTGSRAEAADIRSVGHRAWAIQADGLCAFLWTPNRGVDSHQHVNTSERAKEQTTREREIDRQTDTKQRKLGSKHERAREKVLNVLCWKASLQQQGREQAAEIVSSGEEARPANPKERL